jgi:hypothetical protein
MERITASGTNGSFDGELTWSDNVSFKTTTHPVPFGLGAFLTNAFLRHAAPHPWRNIPSWATWMAAAGLYGLTFRKVVKEEKKESRTTGDVFHDGVSLKA